MESLLEILKRTEAFFAEKGLETPKLETEHLFAHALGCRRLDLYLQFERPLTEPELAKLRPLVRRRGRREPLQHIIGSVDFFGLVLKADARALIPRPETEELVERIINLIDSQPRRTLELGTGTGALVLALAKQFPESEAVAVDLSADALSLARENAGANDLAGHVSFLESDWFSSVESVFDLIVSNPPYLTEEEYTSAQPEVRDFEPREALVAGEAGLACLRQILEEAQKHLAEGGLLALETGIAHHARLTEIAQQCGYRQWQSQRDLTHRDRYFFAWK